MHACGLIGHVYRGCDLFDGSAADSDLPYGPALRGSPVKRKRKGGDEDWKDEKKKLLELRGGSSGGRLRTLLKMDGKESHVAIAAHCVQTPDSDVVRTRMEGGSGSDRHCFLQTEAV